MFQYFDLDLLEHNSVYFENLSLKMNLLGLSFILHYIKLSDGNGFDDNFVSNFQEKVKIYKLIQRYMYPYQLKHRRLSFLAYKKPFG